LGFEQRRFQSVVRKNRERDQVARVRPLGRSFVASGRLHGISLGGNPQRTEGAPLARESTDRIDKCSPNVPYVLVQRQWHAIPGGRTTHVVTRLLARFRSSSRFWKASSDARLSFSVSAASASRSSCVLGRSTGLAGRTICTRHNATGRDNHVKYRLAIRNNNGQRFHRHEQTCLLCSSLAARRCSEVSVLVTVLVRELVRRCDGPITTAVNK